MKSSPNLKLRILLVGAVAALTACSGNATSGGSSAPPQDSTVDTAAAAEVTTTVAAATTVAAVAEPTGADEPLAKCDTKAFKAAFNTKMVMDRCTTTWAVGNSDRDTWNCAKGGCRQVGLYHLSGSWTKTAVCDTTQPLTYWKGSCYHEDMSPVQATDIPPASVQCKLWPANTSVNFLQETGCEITKDVITTMMSGKCDHWTQNPNLPLVKCDSGAGVRAAQAALRKAGMSTDVDGFFGPGTAKAVYNYQSKKGITPTSMIDLETWKSLFPGNAGVKGKDSNKDGVITPDEF